MQSIVIGTAGHIDHGKSALIKALTGTDPDRLQEEKSRGITIDLGFAHLDLAADLKAGIVDVPGHERFVKNMVAGTGGIDLVLMVVAADEGVMPQTREHLDICQLLGIERGVIALTKTDLVDDTDWLEMVTDDVLKEFSGTFLEESPVVRVSAKDGTGLDELRQVLETTARSADLRSSDGPAFLAVDRAFTMRGFGTVITGTLVSGKLRIEDSVDLLPDETGRLNSLKIRGLQRHGEDTEEALAGQRLAINLSGVEKAAIHRGQVLVHNGGIEPGSELEVSLRLLPGAKPLRSRKRLLFHTGTTKVSASLQLLGTKRLEPGASAFVRVRAEEPLVALPGQHFILRGFSAIPGRGTTVGGGTILAILPPTRREKDLDFWRSELETLSRGSLEDRLIVLLTRAGSTGVDIDGLVMRSGIGRRTIDKALQGMLSRRSAFKFDRDRQRFAAAEVVAALADRACEILDTFHAANPLLPGIPAEQLRTELADSIEPKLFKLLLAELDKDGRAVQEGETARSSAHRVRLDAAGTELESSILATYESSGLTPPKIAELVRELKREDHEVNNLVRHLVRTGPLTHLTADLFISTAALKSLEKKLVDYLNANEFIDTQQFKGMVGASRKHVIPLAEYFDRQKVTMRVGDKRVLRAKPRAQEG